MTAFDPAAWRASFFVGSMGASAALTGLLFVAVSINLEQILKFPNLPGRAAGSLAILVAALVVACWGLAPGQSLGALGTEIALAGGVVTLQSVWVTARKRKEGDPVLRRLERLVTLLLPGLVFVGGGLSLIIGGGGGLLLDSGRHGSRLRGLGRQRVGSPRRGAALNAGAESHRCGATAGGAVEPAASPEDV